MKEMMQLSGDDFLQWLRIQLEKREFMNRQWLEKEKLKEELYEILFFEQRLTTEEIEQCFLPFGHAGYLTARQKFEIMLFVLEKDYGKSFLFMEGAEPPYVITEEDVEAVYLQWMLEERLYLSEEEKKAFFVQSLMDSLGLGVLEVLNRVAQNGILIGDLCPALYEQEKTEERIAVCAEGGIIWLPFLAIESKEEMIRIIKAAIAMERRGELTMLDPVLDFVREDGTCMTAVRPPAGKDWGIRILYGATRKEEFGWRKQLDS